MIIAVDFDGTLCCDNIANDRLIRKLKQHQRRGDIVILWTCRTPEHTAEAVSFLRVRGFVPNFVNQNCPQAIQLLGHDPRKIFADIYIDDKGIKP